MDEQALVIVGTLVFSLLVWAAVTPARKPPPGVVTGDPLPPRKPLTLTQKAIGLAVVTVIASMIGASMIGRHYADAARKVHSDDVDAVEQEMYRLQSKVSDLEYKVRALEH